MNGTDANDRDPLEVVLTEFTEDKRQNKSPSIEDYARRYPALAGQIRELFPLVENLERWKSDKETQCLRRNVPREFPFDRLGEYQLIREIGRGGMGVVFQALHVTSQRSVAIKLLPWRFAADMAVLERPLATRSLNDRRAAASWNRPDLFVLGRPGVLLLRHAVGRWYRARKNHSAVA